MVYRLSMLYHHDEKAWARGQVGQVEVEWCGSALMGSEPMSPQPVGAVNPISVRVEAPIIMSTQSYPSTTQCACQLLSRTVNRRST